MFPIRVKTVQESDLRMLGNLARNIQRVLPVTQADIDAAATLGKGWVVWKVFEVSDPLDNMRGGTQLIIRQNSIQPGQNVRRVIFVAGPGGQTVVIRGTDYIVLPDAVANSLSYVKAYGGTEQRNLPDGYTQLEYIESTSTQYIDTGYFFTDIATETVTVDFMRTGTGAGNILYGIRKAYKDNGYAIQFQDSGKTYIQYGESDSGIGTATPGALNTRYTLIQTGPTYSFRGASFTSTGTTPTQSYPLYLFTVNNNGNPSAITPMRVYSFVIKDSNNNIKLNLVPAKNSSGVIGMYDTVSGQFFTNAGTGDFTAGPDAVPTMDIVSNNGVLKLSPNLFNKDLVPDVNQYVLRANGAVSNASTGAWRHSDFIAIEENTDYYVGIVNSTASSAGLAFYDSTQTYISGISMTQLGQQNNIITSPANAKYIRFSFRIDEGHNPDWENTVYFIKGNQPLAEFIPYGQIYTDGTVETINAHGKNLFDGATSGRLTDDGTTVSSETMFVSQFISVKPNTRYTFSYISGVFGQYRRICGYNNKTETSFTALIAKLNRTSGGDVDEYITTSFTTDTNTNYIRVSGYSADTQIQIEPGSTATAYQPYYDGGTATAEMLLKVGNYTDVQSILDGVVTRQVGVKPITGDMVVNYFPSSNRCIISTGDIVTTHTPIICTHFPTATLGDYYINHSSDNQYIYCYSKDCSSLQDYRDFFNNQYNAGTPVIVLYPLAEPTTESVAGQTLQLAQGDNTLEITQASIDGLELEAKYSAAVALTIQEVQDANLDPNVQVTII